MALSSIGSISQTSQLASRVADGIDARREPSARRGFDDMLTSVLQGMTLRSPTNPSTGIIATSSRTPASTAPTFMPTSIADITVLRNATRSTPK